MITSLVPLALALVTATAPARSAASCAPAPAAIIADGLDAPALQGPPQQNPPQKEAEKGAPETAKPKGSAGEQVRRYVGEQVPKIADWLFDSQSSYEGEPLRNRGLRSVPPVAEERFVSGHVTIMRNLGVVIAGADPKIVYISSVLPTGIGSSVDFRPNDVILTLNGQPIQSTQSFETRFNRLSNGSPVEIGLRRGSQRFTVAFYKPSERTNRRPSFPNDRPGSILPD